MQLIFFITYVGIVFVLPLVLLTFLIDDIVQYISKKDDKS